METAADKKYKSDIKKTKRLLAKQKKVKFLIPLQAGDTPDACDTVQINGYKTTIRKGQLVTIPISVARLLSAKYNIKQKMDKVLTERKYNTRITITPPMIKPDWVRYCKHCGREMIVNLIGAEKAMLCYGDTQSIPVGSAYNGSTGARQYVRQYRCPEWKKKLFSRSQHDNYFADQIVTKQEDIMELWKYKVGK